MTPKHVLAFLCLMRATVYGMICATERAGNPTAGCQLMLCCSGRVPFTCICHVLTRRAINMVYVWIV
jgi:hypothetical protein